MTPAAAIAMLDQQLAEHGQTVILRNTNSATGQATVSGFVRGFRPNEIAGTIKQNDLKVVVSPTGLTSFGNPAAGGYVVVNDVPRAIQSAELFKLDDTVVRIEIHVLGG